MPKFLDLKPLKIDYKRSAKLEREEKARREGKHVEPSFAVLDPEVGALKSLETRRNRPFFHAFPRIS